MPNITIPATAQIVSGQHFAGWTWFTKTYNLRTVRFLYYMEAHRDGYQLIYFFKQENYEQFIDELEVFGQDQIDRDFNSGEKLPADGLHNSGGEYTIPPLKEEDKRALRKRGTNSASI